MWKIIVLAILLVIALGLFIWRKFDYVDYNTPKTMKVWRFGLIPLGLAIIFFLASSFTQVHSKQVGVEVEFGKPVGEYGAGLHFKPFWASITKISETVYTDQYGTGAKGASTAIPVRMADGNPATVPAVIRWHVNPAAVDYIYATYHSDDPSGDLRTAVVDTQFQAVVNHVYGTFNPTSNAAKVDLSDPSKANAVLNFNPDSTTMVAGITKEMNDAVKDADGTPLVIIDNITVSTPSYSDQTEARINSLVQQQAKTQQAVQLEATNTALALANDKLKTSLTGQNGVLIIAQQCMQDLADGKFQAPSGFSCWPGGGTGVVLPSASK